MSFQVIAAVRGFWRKHPGISIALLVLGGMGVYIGLGFLDRRSASKFSEHIDLTSVRDALSSYAEMHNGVLPDSWNAMIDNGVLRRSDETPFTLFCEEDVGFYTIPDIRKFAVAFGTRPEMITISEPYVLDAQGKRILLIAPSGETLLDETSFQKSSLRLAEFMKQCAASKSKNSPTSSLTEE